MGRTPSEKPAKLSKKLCHIRKELNLSQGDMVRQLGLEHKLTRVDISKYERGVRVPALLTLLRYAQTAGIWVDVLIDDELDLPRTLPRYPKSEGVRSTSLSRKKHSKK